MSLLTITNRNVLNSGHRCSQACIAQLATSLRSYATLDPSSSSSATSSSGSSHSSSSTHPSSSTSASSSSDLPPLPLAKSPANKVRFYPRPRPAQPHYHHLPRLPPTFGRNQLLPVSDNTRALLESIVAQFDAPIRYAFAYGSGVFEQDGYTEGSAQVAVKKADRPMVDFIFAVTHPAHFHSINMHQNPSHYPLHARTFGSDYVSKVQALGPGVWFNAYVPMGDVTIKYGVTTVDNLCADLLSWRTLYLAGRMHKPLRIIKDDARVRLTQQVNLTSAVRAALLTLPERFTETELYERIAGISYSGDPRMVLPAENRGKVGNIVRKQGRQFGELYGRLIGGLPGVEIIEQDLSARARAMHLKKLPEHLLQGVKANYARRWGHEVIAELEKDEGAYWVKLAGDESLTRVLQEEMAGIVRGPATVQSLKGIVSAGLGKSIKYSSAKIGKWWKSS
ncbi:mitochondrial matrix Mmp37-domain-containing protein [Panaeolus papilionaceus]|nr:mitochondrial matrix Mmp37-domain-containing protein [Panaeolus papilionaceus]